MAAVSPSTSSSPSPSSSIPWPSILLWLTLGGSSGLLWDSVLIHHLLSRGAHQSDVYWSWVLGRWEVTHRAVYAANLPHLNGGNAAGPWVNLEWGWQALLGLLAPHGLSGWPLWALLWLSGLGFSAAVYGILRYLYPARIITPLLAVLPWLLLSPDWPLRPQILSASLWLLLLLFLAQSLRAPRRVWSLVPLWLIWSTLHGDWILVPLLLVWQCGWLLWRMLRQPDQADDLWPVLAKTVGVLMIGSALITVFNPFHAHLWTTAMHLTGNPWITQVIQEWQSPNWNLPGWTGLALLWTAVIGLWAAHRLPAGPWIGWWAGTVLATLWHQRMVLYNLPLTIILLASVVITDQPTVVAVRQAFLGALALALALPLGWLSVTQAYDRALQPATASVALWCRTHPTPGLTVTPYRLGGVWEATGVPRIFLDGRTLWWIQHHRLQPYVAWQQGHLPVSTFVQDNVTRIVWPTTATTPQTLWLEQAHWHPVYLGDGLTVWQPSPVP